MGLVVPAVLPSSQKELEEELAFLTKISSINRVQIDVVDGRFAAPASWPYSAKVSELEAMVQEGKMLSNLDRFEYEVDLMCLDAERAAGEWIALGATRVVFHAETTTDAPRLLASARGRYGAGGLTPLISFGLALNIASDLALVEACLGEIEFVQFMGIAQIGRQGQPFDGRVLEKIHDFKERHPEFSVQVDGGISLAHAKELVALGVSNLVIGSGILRAKDPAYAIAAFEELRSPYGV
jgi:ribulose-phosphate 3-epimerase